MPATQPTTLKAGQACGFDVAAGGRLRICTPTAHQGGDFSFAGFDQAVTRNVNGWSRHRKPYVLFHLSTGMPMCDGNGRPVLELEQLHSKGAVDIMLPGCWRELYADGRLGCRELISAAIGIERAQLTGMASFFVRSRATDEYYDALSRPGIEAGDYLILRALRDVRVGVSACPDVELPGWSAGEVHVDRLNPASRTH